MTNYNSQPTAPASFGWGKVIGMIFAVIIPGAMVAHSNITIFPDSYGLAVGMVSVSIGIAGIFGAASAHLIWALHSLLLLCWPTYTSAPPLLHVALAIAGMWLAQIASVRARSAIDHAIDKRLRGAPSGVRRPQ